VRELQNVIERAVIVSRGGVLRFDDLRAERTMAQRERAADVPGRIEVIPELEWRRRERDNLRAALAASAGRIYGPGGAAELLGIKPTTLLSRLHALGMRRRSSRSASREPGP
jgi:transcriptional regulator of acetoin/glycerol metabolism